MKKFDSNSRGRSNGQARRSNGNQANSHRSPNKKTDAKNSQAWLNSSSKTLTSHLPGMASTNRRGSGNVGSSNVGAYGNDSSQGRNRSDLERNGNGRGFHKNGRPQNKNRRPFKNRQNQNGGNGAGSNSSFVEKKQAISDPTKVDENSQGMDPFRLFCAYHLGIGPNNTYKPSNINQVAQQFGLEPGAIRQATREFGFDSESMLNKDFDLALAQLDIQVAPEGICKVELAKGLYEEFLNAPVLKRDWGKIIEEDKKENARVFGS